MQLVQRLAVDGIVYMPASEKLQPGYNMSKPAVLNRVVSKIYPSGTAIKPSELVAVFEDDQLADKAFLMRLVPHMGEEKNIRMVHTPLGYQNCQESSDIFDLVRPCPQQWHTASLPQTARFIALA